MSDMCSTIEAKLQSGKIILPSLPEITIQVRKIAANPNATIKDLSEFICQDAGISAQLIRLAQTMRYSRPNYVVSSLTTAINRIGMHGTINLIMAMSILQGYSFHSKTLYSLCKEDNELSRQICRYGMTIYEKLFGELTQEKADFIALAAVFLNIGSLPIYSELDSIERITKVELNRDFVIKLKKDLSSMLGKKILETWKFNKDFIELQDLNINENYSDTMKSIIYAHQFVLSTPTDKISPLSKNIVESFCCIEEGTYKDILIDHLKDKGLIKE